MSTTPTKESGWWDGSLPAALQWEKAVALRTTANAEPYPICDLPPIIASAIEEVEETTQAPIALVAASALSSISACVQGLASVQRNEHLRGPTSLYMLSVASSGERKSTTDKYFMTAIREWENDGRRTSKPALAEYRANLKAWKATEAGYEEALRKEAKDGVALVNLPNPLTAHECAMPVEPRVPSMLRMDDTPEALAVALSRWPIAAILSAEAGIIFGAHGMNPDSVARNLAQMNTFWDGGHLKRNRTTTQSIDIEDMRVTAGLMVQPEVLENFMSKSGALARGIGYLSRFLFAQPESTQGNRFYREPKPGLPALAAFNLRVLELLSIRAEVNEDDGRLTTRYVPLDAAAKEIWIDFHDSVEAELGWGRDYFSVQDVASKAAENAARLACCFHVFCSGGGEIGAVHMRAGATLMRWYLDEALRFCKMTGIPTNLRNAERVETFLATYVLQKGVGMVERRNIQQYGPSSLRGDKKSLDEALGILETHNRIKLLPAGKRGFHILINPSVLQEYR